MEEPDDGARQRAAVALAVAVPEVSLQPRLLEKGLYVDRDNFFRNIDNIAKNKCYIFMKGIIFS
jgi:hypothetical protein